MANNTWEIEGLKELQTYFNTLEVKLKKVIVRKALREGAKIIKLATLKFVPVKSGKTKDSIKVRAAKRKTGRIAYLVQIGKGDFQGETFYASFLEYGFRLKTKYGSKTIPAQAFMRQGFDSSKEAAKNKALEILKKEIENHR